MSYYDEDLNHTARAWFAAPEVRLLDVSLKFARFEPAHLAQALGEQAAVAAKESANDDISQLQLVSHHLGKAIAHMTQDHFALAIFAFKKNLAKEENAFTSTIEPGLYSLNTQAREQMANGLASVLSSDVAGVNQKKRDVLVLVTDFDAPGESYSQKKSLKP
jgi:hypothetical protein